MARAAETEGLLSPTGACVRELRLSRASLCLTTAALAWLTFLGSPERANAARRESVHASTLTQALEAGKPVVRSGVDVRGTLRLPKALDVPLILRDSRLQSVVGAYGSFSGVVDLSGSVVRGGLDFAGARFDAPFLFGGRASRVVGPSSFSLAIFGESARFGGTRFGGTANFSLAGFDRAASFASAHFDRAATFAGTDFRSAADFSASDFSGKADFSDARFGARADFIGATFDAGGVAGPSVDFSRASFDAGATFLSAEVSAEGRFERATSSGHMDFQEAKFLGAGNADSVANFSTARFLGEVSFTDAELDGFVNFDQAVIANLDLEQAAISGSVRLPLGRQSRGRIGSLQLDIGDANHIDGPGEDDRPAQEAAFALVESSARAGDDLETANDARMKRLTIVRKRKWALPETLDFAFNYGFWGYGVRPFHQLIAIAAALAFGTAARTWKRRKSISKSLGESLGTFLRLHPPTGAWNVVEYLGFKVLIVMLVLNAANVWPVSRELIEGVF